MDENNKTKLSEDQLDAVAGGGGTGDVSDPCHDSNCWFKADGKPREDPT